MRILFSIFSLFISSLLMAQRSHPPLTISHLTKDFYVYVTYNDPGDGSSFPSNSMYLVTRKGVILFDTPWDSTQFQPLLDSIQARHHKKVLMCISTHFHADRTAGLAYYRQKGIATYTTRRTDELSAARKQQRAQYLLSNDTTFSFGNYTFQTFYPGEGHSPDNIVVWFPKEKILYGGCFVKSTEAATLGNLSDANTNAWPVSVKNIFSQLGTPLFVIPGHQSWASNQSLQHTLDLLLEYNQKKNH